MAALTKFTMDDIHAITGGLNINQGIANGTSFRVYLGSIKRGNPWKLPKQTVVVKAPVDNNPQSIQAFERELAALTSLQHKYIVKLIGYRNEGDQRYLVVEYLANGTLLDNIDESLTWPHVRRMLKGVARGIEYIHGMKLVHTDICPANILIDKRYKVKLNGLGCVVEENQDVVAEYRDGFRPEQIHAGAKARKSDDLYSFGVTTLMLTKKTTSPTVTIDGAERSLAYLIDNGTFTSQDIYRPYKEDGCKEKHAEKLFKVVSQLLSQERDDNLSGRIAGELQELKKSKRYLAKKFLRGSAHAAYNIVKEVAYDIVVDAASDLLGEIL